MAATIAAMLQGVAGASIMGGIDGESSAMTIVPGPLASAADGVPREYNFAANIPERNLRAGRAYKAAYVDPRGSWCFGQALRAPGVGREQRILLDPPGAIKAAPP
jgi:hypothetical protein